MKRIYNTFSTLLLLAILVFAGTSPCQPAFAQEEDRSIVLSATYPYLIVPVDENEVVFNFTLTNEGDTGENIFLEVDSAPEDWGYQFRAVYPEYAIAAVYLPSKQNDEEKAEQNLRFNVTLPGNETPGDYTFIIKAITEDNAVESSLSLTVSLTREIVSIKTEEVELTPESATVRSEVGSDFEFVIHVDNNTEQDLTFDLEAEVPPEWTVYITHGWREDRISTLMVKSGETEDARLVVTPSPYQEPGKYPREYEVTFRVKSGEFEDSVDLRAIITATYELVLTTTLERPQLNVAATAGQETHITLSLINSGTAALEDISFTSSKPDGWEITYAPDKLESLDANSSREIDVSIRPGEKTIAGDYATVLKANSMQGSDSLDYRVTVETPTAWGWIGVIIAILVIATLFGTFVMLRRR
jgi:uncharacterized membrane protein